MIWCDDEKDVYRDLVEKGEHFSAYPKLIRKKLWIQETQMSGKEIEKERNGETRDNRILQFKIFKKEQTKHDDRWWKKIRNKTYTHIDTRKQQQQQQMKRKCVKQGI